jgi:hypothetical protein
MKIRHVQAAFQRLLSKAILASSWLELGKPIKRKQEKFTKIYYIGVDFIRQVYCET